MTAHFLPALIALLFKIAILVYALRAPARNATTQLFLVLLMLFAAHNAVEVAGFWYFARYGLTEAMVQIGYLYFAIAIACTAVALHVSLRLSIDRWDSFRPLAAVIYVPVVVLEYLLFATDQLIAGFTPFQDYTILRVRGPLYFLFETFAIVYALAALAYLFYGARSSRPSIIGRLRNRLWLVALLPLALLHSYLIIANHFGLAKVSSTISIPIALTFFLAVTTYATHQHRLFDIAFFLPWSKVRKRKTAFYDRIRSAIAELANQRSVRDVISLLSNCLHCHVALIGNFRAVYAGADDTHVTRLWAFPRSALDPLQDIVVAAEISDSNPSLHAVMREYNVGAIVPLATHNRTAGHWLLLSDHVANNVYSALDFRRVEQLLARIADVFVDDLLLLRGQLADAQEEIRLCHDRLALAWMRCDEHKVRAQAFENQVKRLREELPTLRRAAFKVIDGTSIPSVDFKNTTLDTYLAQCEAHAIRTALRQANGDKVKAARLLGLLSPRNFQSLLERYAIDPKEYA